MKNLKPVEKALQKIDFSKKVFLYLGYNPKYDSYPQNDREFAYFAGGGFNPVE